MLLNKNNFNKIKRLGVNRRKFIYSKKTYANPFFQRGRAPASSRRGLANKSQLTIFAAIVIILIFIWLIFFSTLFKINKIEVTGVEDNTAKDVLALARGLAENRLVGKNNLILYDKSELSRILNEKYYLENLTIKKRLGHTLKINLLQKQQAAVWHEDDKYYYIDGAGKIINQVDSLNINRDSYPLIENLTDIKMEERQANIGKPTIDYIINLFNEFTDQKHNFDIERFIVDKDVHTVKMAVLGGPKIYFNIERAMGEQAAKLDLIIKERLGDNFKTKEYIDLRYGNNIYIK